jgi:protein TonB
MAEAVPMASQRGSLRYGAYELKQNYQKYWAIGFGIAVGIHMLLFLTYFLVQLMQAEEPPTVTVRILKYSDLGPPPSIVNNNTPPPVMTQAQVQKPTVGAPVPVPDAEVTTEQTMATQQQMSEQTAPVAEGTNAPVEVQQDIKIEDDAPPADFVPVEKEPVPVKSVKPKYPEMAQKANLEGKVWVKIWVDKEGRPKQVIIMKSDAEIFNEAAVEAAKQFIFTPAYMNNGPVAVWVSVPFIFKLNGLNK